MVFERLKEKLSKAMSQKSEKAIAVFVDGPNILRKEFNIDLQQITAAVQKFGRIKIGKVFLNQYASNKLIEAVVNQGYESVITVGDVDVCMAVEATESIFNDKIDVIALVTRDSDFLPAIVKAKKHGKLTIVALVEEASAVALKNTADHVIVLKEKPAKWRERKSVK